MLRRAEQFTDSQTFQAHLQKDAKPVGYTVTAAESPPESPPRASGLKSEINE